MAIKLDQSEIKAYIDIFNERNSISSEVGKIEIFKFGLQQELDSVNAKKEELLKLYRSNLEAQQDQNSKLLEKYGNGNLNTDTWEFTPVNDQPSTEELPEEFSDVER